MKNNNIIASIVMTILLFTGITYSRAQEIVYNRKVEFGLRLMPTISSFDVKNSAGAEVSGNVVLGFGAAAFLGFNFTNHVGVQGELVYSSISQKSYDINVKQKINLRYVSVPLLLSLNTGKSNAVNLNLVGGPQFGFNVGSSMTISGQNDVNSPQPVLSVKKNDFSLAYGAGLDFALNPARTVRLGLGYRGVMGLLDISDKSATATGNSYYVLESAKVKTNSAYIGFSILF